MEHLARRDGSRNTDPLDIHERQRERTLWAIRPAARIALRFGLPIATAATIARLAGLGELSR